MIHFRSPARSANHALSDNHAPCAAQLNLTQYWGVWGGKYCYSAYDPPPPPGKNITKAPCPVIKQPPVPKIRPVDLPRIIQLSGGQIFVGGASPQPIQIKVTQYFQMVAWALCCLDSSA